MSEKRQPARIERLAEVLGSLGQTQAANLLLRVAERDPVLAETLRAVMFRFDDLVLLRDQSVPVLFSAVPRGTWLLAMRGAGDAVREKVLSNMSQRARGMFEDDLAVMQKQRRSDVDRARAEVVTVALRLEDEGRVFIDRPGAPDVYV